MSRRAPIRIATASLAVVLAGIVSRCGEPPTAPSQEPIVAAFIAGFTVLAPGEATQLRSYRMAAGEEIVESSSMTRWESSSLGVASVTNTGLLRATAEGEALVSASIAGVVGTARVFVVRRGMLPVDEYVGRWTGTLRVASCHRLLGTGRNPCQPGRSGTVEIILARDAGILAGTFRLASSPPGRVRGFKAENGALVFSGSLPDPPYLPEWHIRHLRLDLDGDVLRGSDLTDRTFPNVFGPQVLEERHELELTRVQ
jgi:hypothetical protein